jgi:hypothetical protein
MKLDPDMHIGLHLVSFGKSGVTIYVLYVLGCYAVAAARYGHPDLMAIQPRPHDKQLTYVNNVTKILSLERPLRFVDFATRLVGNLGDIYVKY